MRQACRPTHTRANATTSKLPTIAFAIVCLVGAATYTLSRSRQNIATAGWGDFMPGKYNNIASSYPSLTQPFEHVNPNNDAKAAPCKRTLLYTFAGSHGFASEYLIFIRVALLAREFGYELLIDDTHWNYGRWNNYFEPISPSCTVPSVGNRSPLVPGVLEASMSAKDTEPPDSRPSWTQSDHVIWLTRKIDYLDDLITRLYVDAGELARLHAEDRRIWPPLVPLDSNHTLPLVFREVFSRMSQVARDLWRPNTNLQDAVRAGSVALAGQRLPCSIMGAHIRHGDKELELGKFGPQVWSSSSEKTRLTDPTQTLISKATITYGQNTDSQTWHSRTDSRPAVSPSTDPVDINTSIAIAPGSSDAYFQAAENALLQCRAQSPAASPADLHLLEKTKLILMSDDHSQYGLLDFLTHRKSHLFDLWNGSERRIFETSPTGYTGLSPMAGSDSTASVPGAKTRHAAGFDESVFNASPIQDRVSAAIQFLRDLTILASHADGIVITASSNVGRLLALLLEPEKGSDININSVDIRWFPTARYQ